MSGESARTEFPSPVGDGCACGAWDQLDGGGSAPLSPWPRFCDTLRLGLWSSQCMTELGPGRTFCTQQAQRPPRACSGTSVWEWSEPMWHRVGLEPAMDWRLGSLEPEDVFLGPANPIAHTRVSTLSQGTNRVFLPGVSCRNLPSTPSRLFSS